MSQFKTVFEGLVQTTILVEREREKERGEIIEPRKVQPRSKYVMPV
jgi:hypothetical protein